MRISEEISGHEDPDWIYVVIVKAKRLICFAPSALDWLKDRAEDLDISVSELVRRIIDEKRVEKKRVTAKR